MKYVTTGEILSSLQFYIIMGTIINSNSTEEAGHNINNIFSKEKLNTGRQYNLDLLKALAVVAMIICHTVTMLSEARPNYESEFWYWVADAFIGSYLAVAHAFMFCMGVGFVYSKNSSPKYLIIRGIKIYIMAYVLNFFRGGMYAIIASLFDPSYLELVSYTMLMQDILQFAGLAMILTALFKTMKMDYRLLLFVAVLMSVFSQFAAMKFQGNTIANILVGTFIPVGESGFESTFVLCGWYIFVAAGICFGVVLQKVKNLDSFYKLLLIISSIIMFTYIAATAKYGCFFMSPGNQYYYANLFESVGLLSIDLVLASLMHFGINKVSAEKLHDSHFFNICLKTSRNVNQIYFVQWCIIGILIAVFVYLLELSIPYWITYIASVIVVVLSYLVTEQWMDRKKVYIII